MSAITENELLNAMKELDACNMLDASPCDEAELAKAKENARAALAAATANKKG